LLATGDSTAHSAVTLPVTLPPPGPSAALADVITAEVLEGRVVPGPLAPVDAPKLGPVDPVLEKLDQLRVWIVKEVGAELS